MTGTATTAAPKRKRGKKKQDDLKCEVVQTFREMEEGPRRFHLRAERWIKNGVPGKVKMARRQIFVNKEGVERTGGAKGLSESDCEYIAVNWAEIKGFFQ